MNINIFAKKKNLNFQTTSTIRNFSIFLLLFSLLLFNTLIYNIPIANADEVLATIPVGMSPVGLTFNDFNKNMYIANANSNTVSVIDSDSNQVIATIPVGDLTINAFDSPMEFNPFNKNLYVANDGSNTVSVIDSSTNTVIKTINVGLAPFEPEFNPFNNNMYVVNRGSSVSVIDSNSNTEIGRIAVGINAQNILYNPFNNNMYVANTGSGTVSVINVITGSVTTIFIPVPGGNASPRDLEFNPFNNKVYVSNFGSAVVSVIDSTSNTVIATIPVDGGPSDLEFNPFNNNIYVAHSGGGTGSSVEVIDSNTHKVTAEVPIGKSTFDLEFSPFNNNMYVSTSGPTATNVVEVIDSTSNTVIDRVTVGINPEHLKFNPTNNFIYTANRASNTVSVVGVQVPDTIINNAIDGNNKVLDTGDTSTSDSITFTFSGLLDGSSRQVDGFECSLDGLEFEDCSTGSKTYKGLSTGNHEFKVKAFVLDTNDKKIFDPSPASFNWIISIVMDTNPPETQILSATDRNGDQLNEGDKTSSNSITFEFNGQDETSVQENLVFECSLDSATFEQCTSPLNFNSISSGEHTFAVRAIDEAGNTDQSPAEFTWIVDNTPPETEITSAENGQGTELFNSDTTVSPTISISFTGSDDWTLQQNLIFECSLDSATFEQCTSPYIKEDLEFGEHTFAVRAIDEVGNTDQSPDEFTWTILTLSEGVTEIETIIEDLTLPQGVENSLKAQLSQSTRILNDANPNNDIAVCDKLDSFILEVDKKFFNGQLSSEDATMLIAKANAISNELGC